MKARQRGDEIDETTLFDSNCITPGTEFMEIIDKHLRYFIRKKIKEDPVWRDLEVIYSGHDVPGEGEHKIMQYIRDTRQQPNYQPNIRHCLYGQDADLIMLGLASHEPHFTLLREVVDFNVGRNFNSKRDTATVMKQTKDPKFQLLHLSVLREYIEVDFAYSHTGEPIDLERLIDDFIFLTFLVGNDFLPHLPTLDISEHAFDVLFDIYRSLQAEHVSYIVENGEIADYKRLEQLFHLIGLQEEEILRTRELEQKDFNARRRKNRRGYQAEEMISPKEEEEEEMELQAALERAIAESLEESRLNNQLTGLQIQDSTNQPTLPLGPDSVTQNDGRDHSEVARRSGLPVKNYRARYYFEKFHRVADPGNSSSGPFNQFIQDISAEYLRGIIWCLAYYMKGCVSWTWYFPYHYGPMLCDMTNLAEKASHISFEVGRPFLPFQQLLGCLPPSSLSLLPLPYQWLMKSNSSPILEYYPEKFDIDMNGKRNPWEAVVLLPFIDSSRLLEAEAMYCPSSSLTSHERQRNSFGKILSFIYFPTNLETILAGNTATAIGLMDITNCQTKLTEYEFDLFPSSTSFLAKLIPGTVKTCAGYPSLGVIALSDAKLENIKLNVFGSESRYKSIILSVTQRFFSIDGIQYEKLLNCSVFVNYPLIHEAKVIGVSCVNFSLKLKTRSRPPRPPPHPHRVGREEEIQYEIEKTIHSESEKIQWLKDSANEEMKYLKGRGLPGTGGIVIGNILIRLLVVPLQGMKTDRLTGIRKKVFGETVADIPIQVRERERGRALTSLSLVSSQSIDGSLDISCC
jgi:5'-3' exoribonuclease 1